jgi:hypothetical protein
MTFALVNITVHEPIQVFRYGYAAVLFYPDGTKGVSPVALFSGTAAIDTNLVHQ